MEIAMPPPVWTTKSFEIHLADFARSLKLIRTSIEHISEGKLEHTPALSSQLRSLLIDKSGLRLFYHIAEALDINTDSYYAPTQLAFLPPNLSISGISEIHDPHLSRFQTDEKDHAIGLEEALKLKVISCHGRSYSLEDAVNCFANELGGAHYAKQIKHFADLLRSDNIAHRSLGISPPPLTRLLMNIGRFVFNFGLDMLRRYSNFEIRLVVRPIVPTSMEYPREGFLLDAMSKSDDMRIYIRIADKGRLVGFAGGHLGPEIEAFSTRKINWNKPTFILYKVALDDNLNTNLELHIDGHLLTKFSPNEFMVLSGDPTDYRFYINRSTQEGQQQLSFALAHLSFTSFNTPPVDRAKQDYHALMLCSAENFPVELYNIGSYGHSIYQDPSNHRNHSGDVVLTNLSDIDTSQCRV